MWLTSLSLREARKVGTWRQKLKQGPQRHAADWPAQFAFLGIPGPLPERRCEQLGPLGSETACGQADGSNSTCRSNSLFPDDSSFCQVHRNQSAQRRFRIIYGLSTNKALDTPVKIPHYLFLQFK